MTVPVDVVVLLGLRLTVLEDFVTRWGHVLRHWAGDPRVRSLTVMDYPRFGGPTRVVEQGTWLTGARSFGLQCRGRRAGGPGEGAAWRALARSAGLSMNADPSRRVVISASPLPLPLGLALPAARHGFDAVDDVRAHPATPPVRRRVERGYVAAQVCDVVTSVSPVLSDRLRSDYGVKATTVPNGVDLTAFRQPPAPAPAGLPASPFAVYVGAVQERVDLDLLVGCADRLRGQLAIVVAGPLQTPEAERRLRASAAVTLGAVPSSQVPALLERAVVGLLPHHLDAFTSSMNPMKLLEYLAAGLPVVATGVPDASLTPRIVVSQGVDAFSAEVLRSSRLPRAAVEPWLAARDWAVMSDQLLTTHAKGLL